MCLSGEVEELDATQWQSVCHAMNLYRQAAPIIKHGTSRIFGNLGPSWRHPVGWQAVRRIIGDGKSILLVVHAFARAPSSIEVPWPNGAWKAVGQLFGQPTPGSSITDGMLTLSTDGDFAGAVFVLKSN